MIIGSIYVSMLMTNWAATDLTEKTFTTFTPNNLSMWIKLISAWITAILYMWTAIATRVFDDEENEYQDN